MNDIQQQAIESAANGAPIISLKTPFFLFVPTFLLTALAVVTLWVMPEYYAPQVSETGDLVMMYALTLLASFAFAFMAMNLPLWFILRNQDNGYGDISAGAKELKEHYYAYYTELSNFVLKRNRKNLSLTSRFIISMPLNAWLLVLAAFAFNGTRDEMTDAVSHHQRIKDAAYDTLQARDFCVNGVPFTMIYVKGGTYTMGATKEQGFNWQLQDEDYRLPLATVTVSGFHIGRTEVTNGLWDAVMGTYSGDPKRPKVYVSRFDCQAFIDSLNHITGEEFRLATCAEWEWAARGGVRSKGYRYSGSDYANRVACYGQLSWSWPKKAGLRTYANELGIFDMSGNVSEWVLDISDKQGNRWRDGMKDPVVIDNQDKYGVISGGDFMSDEAACRVSAHRQADREARFTKVGLRLVLSPIREKDLTIVNWQNADELHKRYNVALTPQPQPQLIATASRTITQGGLHIEIEPETKEMALADLSAWPAGQAMDMKLSVKWCSSNAGAATILDYGNYYTWSEARKLQNGGWRLPTDAEQRELMNKCKWKRLSINGIDGYLVTAPNGNRIFLPSGGYCKNGEARQQGTHGYYWSGQTMEGFHGEAIEMYFTNQEVSTPRQDFRDCDTGLPVRLVRKQ